MPEETKEAEQLEHSYGCPSHYLMPEETSTPETKFQAPSLKKPPAKTGDTKASEFGTPSASNDNVSSPPPVKRDVGTYSKSEELGMTPGKPKPRQKKSPGVKRNKKIARRAWRIFLGEINEEGLALISDKDARELARRSLRVTEIYCREEAATLRKGKQKNPAQKTGSPDLPEPENFFKENSTDK